MVYRNGQGSDMLQDDDDKTVFANTLDSSRDAPEGTIGERGLTAFFTNEIGKRQEGAVVVGTIDRHGTHELMHLTIRDGKDFRRLSTIV